MIVIGKNEKEAIGKVLAHAHENIISFEEMKEIRDGEKPAVGNRSGFTCKLPGGHRCAFSIEHHPKADDSGTIPCRHLSVSVAAKKKWPLPDDVEIIMREFGFRGDVKKCGVYTETDPTEAVNLVQTLDEMSEAAGSGSDLNA